MCYHVRASCGERTLMCCRETNFTKIMVVQKQNLQDSAYGTCLE